MALGNLYHMISTLNSMALNALVLLFLLGSMTKDSRAQTMFVQRGGNVLLQLKEPNRLESNDVLFWRSNISQNIVRFIPGTEPLFQIPNKRFELFSHDLSLLIKNLTLADSQDYTAVVSGTSERVVAKYTIEVQDAVSPVVLHVSSVSLGGDSCNSLHTATCSAASSVINSTFRCIGQTCKQEGEEQSKHTPSDSTLRIYLLSDSIITCNHSNQVSWTNETKEIQHFCAFESAKASRLWMWTMKVLCVTVFCTATGGLVRICCNKRPLDTQRKRRKKTSSLVVFQVQPDEEDGGAGITKM